MPNYSKYKPQGNDGSYLWTKTTMLKQEAKVKAEFDKRFEQVKQILKNKTPSITAQDNQLYAQWSSYVWWDNTPMQKPHRVKKSFKQLTGASYPLTAHALDKALKIVLELEERIATGKFTWLDYWRWVPKKYQPAQNCLVVKSIGDWLIDYKEHWFSVRNTSTKEAKHKTERKWLGNIKIVLNHLPVSETLNDSILLAWLNHYPPHTRSRAFVFSVAKDFCEYIGYSFDFEPYKAAAKYKPNKRQQISDQQIVEAFNEIKPKKNQYARNWKIHKWMFGMMAVYGLRNHEVLNIRNLTHPYTIEEEGITLPAFNDPNCTEKVIYTSGKTGERIQPLPYPKHWIKLFDLENVPNLPTFESLKQKDNFIKSLTIYCKRIYRIDFSPYYLRHAYAMRLRDNGVNPQDGKDYMGHSLEMYDKTYNRGHAMTSLIKNARNFEQKVKAEQTELSILEDKVKELEYKLAMKEEEIKALKMELRLNRELREPGARD